VLRTYKYTLIPNARQQLELQHLLYLCCSLYNACLEQRISAYRKQKKTVSKFDQYVELTALREVEEEYKHCSSRILRSAIDRLDHGFKQFFSKVKKNIKTGFPRFKSNHRYSSFSFPAPIVEGKRVLIPRFGYVKFNAYRPVKGSLKEARICRTSAGWTLSLVCELGPAPAKTDTITTSTGIDVGLASFATFSDGRQIANPRFYRQSEELLAKRQQVLARKKKGSNSRKRAKTLVFKAHQRIRNQRLDFVRKLAKETVRDYDLVAHEQLNIKGMVKAKTLAKSIHDASWNLFIQALANKAEEAGKHVIGVNPRYTSQKCSGCGKVVKKALSERTHGCDSCGLVLDRDHNAALNIHALGLSVFRRGPDEVMSCINTRTMTKPSTADF
jgi:putative transposase